MKVAFYAPLKEPDHPVPSGDRQMARLLIEALRLAGHDVTVVSRLRSFMATPDGAKQVDFLGQSEREAGRITQVWAQTGRPDLWFTYHNHYKAPDLLGPDLTRAFDLPLVMAEASHAPKRAGEWSLWHEAAEAATRAAAVHLSFTARDRVGIEPLLRSGASSFRLLPFIDGRALARPIARPDRRASVSIVTVAMMRPGDKLASYRFLATALARLEQADWHLTVIGDGPARPAVEAEFAGLPPERVRWRGALPEPAVVEALHQADLFAWPGFGEAFGLAYLEAQAAGLPVVALDVAGVATVVTNGEGGLLVSDLSPDAYAKALQRLMQDPAGRRAMGRAAAIRVRRDHMIGQAALTLSRAVERACTEPLALSHV